jgi:4-diphosphocytidyl-2-C-methyl-D-erythritol kinase
MTQAGGLGTLMSGSGPTVFTLTLNTGQKQRRSLKAYPGPSYTDPDLGIWVTEFMPTGIQLEPTEGIVKIRNR